MLAEASAETRNGVGAGRGLFAKSLQPIISRAKTLPRVQTTGYMFSEEFDVSGRRCPAQEIRNAIDDRPGFRRVATDRGSNHKFNAGAGLITERLFYYLSASLGARIY